MSRRRRGRVVAVIFVVLVAVGGGVATWLAAQGWGQAADQDDPELPAATTEVTRQTLTASTSFDGELGYGVSETITNRLTGTITGLPQIGDVIKRGKALYSVDDQPVILLYGDLPAYRTLNDGDEGTDVEQLEQNLAKLGYEGFTVDDEYTWYTAQAVEEWQEDLGVEETGEVELGQVVFLPKSIRVEALPVQLGDPATAGQSVLSHTATAQAVTVDLDPSDLAVVDRGDQVGIELPDGTTVDGKVTDISTKIESGSSAEAEAETTVSMVAELTGDEAKKAVAEYDQAAVDVVIITEEREDVLAVPVTALLALADGGYGLEVVAGGTSSYVKVSTGLFADGKVEITGERIDEGTIVGMPE